MIARFTLEKPWEGWVVNDKRVAHYVWPIEVAAGYERGRRVILLTDFTPMAPDIQH